LATWDDFCGVAATFGGTRLSDAAWRFDLQVHGEGRAQKVFAFYELMKPDLEFLKIASAFAEIDAVDCEAVLKAFGQLNVGSIAYTPRFDAAGNPIDGFLTLATSLPLATLDLSEPLQFMLYLNIFARAADTIEQQVSTPGSRDLF
jgi:hypothetical protein